MLLLRMTRGYRARAASSVVNRRGRPRRGLGVSVGMTSSIARVQAVVLGAAVSPSRSDGTGKKSGSSSSSSGKAKSAKCADVGCGYMGCGAGGFCCCARSVCKRCVRSCSLTRRSDEPPSRSTSTLISCCIWSFDATLRELSSALGTLTSFSHGYGVELPSICVRIWMAVL